MKKVLIGIIAIFICFGSNAQEGQKKFDINKLEIGGSFGMSFGSSRNSDVFGIHIMPKVGYRFSNMFSAGLGIGYAHQSWDDYSENYAGLSIYGRFRPIRYLSINAEPQVFQLWRSGESSRTVPCLLLGAGAIIPMGNNFGISVSLSYDVIRDDFSPYSNGWYYSVGFVYGF